MPKYVTADSGTIHLAEAEGGGLDAVVRYPLASEVEHPRADDPRPVDTRAVEP